MLIKIGKNACCALLGIVAMLAFNGAWAKDALVAAIESSAAYTFDQNGNPLAKGTYAIGTLKVYLVVVGNQWPSKLLLPEGLKLDMSVRAGASKPYTNYEVPIRLRQVGGDLTLTPVPATLDVASADWAGSSQIDITVPETIINDPDLNVDGTELVGNLQIDPTVTRTHLDTVTTLRIFAKLVHPDEVACLKTATFVSNNTMSNNLSSSEDGLNFTYGYKNPAASVFSWTVTPGNNTLQDDVLVVNTCNYEQTYDVKIGLAGGFQVKAPGNVVTSYVSQVANADDLPLIDPYTELKDAINGSDYSAGVATGTALCLPINTLPGMYSQWLKANVELITTGFTSAAGIPDVGSTYTMFTSDIYDSNTVCAADKVPAVTQGTAVVYVKTKSCTVAGDIKSCSPPL